MAEDIEHAATATANGEEESLPTGRGDDLAGALGINLEPQWRSMWVDLGSLMNPTPYTVQVSDYYHIRTYVL